jgi:hypothetical protein
VLEDPDRDLGPRVPPRSLAEVEFASATRRRTARVLGLGAIALAVAVVVVAIVARDSIRATWPATDRVYRSFGLIASPSTGLEIAAVTQQKTADSLIVAGDIVNRADAAHRVPRLRVALHDGNRTELDSQLIDPPVETLAPGATAHFTTVFDHPSMTASGVTVTFASEP